MRLNFSFNASWDEPTAEEIEQGVVLFLKEVVRDRRWSGLSVPEIGLAQNGKNGPYLEICDWQGDEPGARDFYVRHRCDEGVFTGLLGSDLSSCGAVMVRLLEAFRVGQPLLETFVENGFIWCRLCPQSAGYASGPCGETDEADDEELDQAACVTQADIVDLMLDVESRSPDMAALLMAEPLDEEVEESALLNPISTRETSLAWMRVVEAEDMLDSLARIVPDWDALPETRRKEFRSTWRHEMGAVARLTRDRSQWNYDLELSVKWLELRRAFRQAQPFIERLALAPPPEAVLAEE